ncbi:MAG: hypothetical protein V1859_01000 [archaeon]
MKRKLIQLGTGTLLVSIPNEYVQKYRLTKGQEIDVSEEDECIKISPNKAIKKVSKYTIDTRKGDLFDIRIINYIIKTGVDEIQVFFNKKEVYSQIEKEIPNLFGFEIMEIKSGSCIIKSIAGQSSEELDNILRRAFISLINFSDEIYENLTSGKKEALNEIILIEKNIDRLTDYYLRCMFKENANKADWIFDYLVARDIEKIADYYKQICLSKNRPQQKFISAFLDTNKLLRKYYELYYNIQEDLEALKLLGEIEKLKEKLAGNQNESPNKDFNLLLGIIFELQHLIGPYVEKRHVENTNKKD